MARVPPRMTNLFLQLGLDASAAGIAQFIEQHQLPADVDLANAPFWNAAQRELLSDQLSADTAWSTVVDQLNESLHEDAVQRQTGR